MSEPNQNLDELDAFITAETSLSNHFAMDYALDPRDAFDMEFPADYDHMLPSVPSDNLEEPLGSSFYGSDTANLMSSLMANAYPAQMFPIDLTLTPSYVTNIGPQKHHHSTGYYDSFVNTTGMPISGINPVELLVPPTHGIASFLGPGQARQAGTYHTPAQLDANGFNMGSDFFGYGYQTPDFSNAWCNDAAFGLEQQLSGDLVGQTPVMHMHGVADDP
ncbi:hypothetical protein ACHAQH_005821 [Verticillium albo-atrum]